MLSGWRIADPEFSATPDQMMSGEGAYLNGGRWNSKGVRVVYLGSSLAQASMELLIHLGRTDILNAFHKMEVTLAESLVQHIDLTDLPADWATPSMAPSVQAVGDDWVADASSLVLQVPSAAIQGEYNYLYNPLHPDAGLAVFGLITPFDYDPRLLKA
ncbi:MAG: RES domain-containing protein [Motiliproteus sp.]|jgi:RES domain-containing protein